MKPVIFADLDDSLFQTAPKCPNGIDGLLLMSTLADGAPSGYATATQQNFLRWLRIGQVIPVTARGTDVLARVNIEQAPAICSNGGCILTDAAEIDGEWHDQLVERARHGDAVEDVYAAMTTGLSDAFRHWMVSENGLPLYIVVKSNHGAADALEELAERLHPGKPTGWRRHSNGNNLAYLPPWLNKRDAVAYLIARIRTNAPDTPVVGIGDSLSDVGFMDLCDFAMTPTNSQFWTAVTHDNDWIG